MDNIILQNIIKVIIISIILIILTFSFVKIYLSILFENRIKDFALEPNDNSKNSLIDVFISKMFVHVKKVSKFISKSHVLNDYADRFNKYFIYNDNANLKSIDYISIKFLVTFCIDILYILYIFFRFTKFNVANLLLISVVSFFACDIFIIIIFRRKKSLISEQLLEAVVIMNSAFKSGKNILGAIEIVKTELPNPIKTEFNIIYKDLTYGISVAEAFSRFEKRIVLDEAKLITSSLSLLSKTGGNIVTVFNMIEKNFYDRLKIKNELEALTATSKLLYRVLIFIPFILILLIITLNPTYFVPLINNKIGYLIDGLIAILYVIYIIVIKKIMRVEEL